MMPLIIKFVVVFSSFLLSRSLAVIFILEKTYIQLLIRRKNVNQIVENRAIEIGTYISINNSTVRKAAKNFGISKSTVHKDVSERLKTINPDLYFKVKMVMENNKAIRHIRGGIATKNKFKSF